MSGAERIGAPSQIRLTQLSIFTLPPRPSVLAAIKGWFDDSLRGDVWAVGGYAGADHKWNEFDFNWPIILAKHDVPYFHMKEMSDPTGPFAKWRPPQDHESERAEFFGDLASVISKSRLVGFSSIVRMMDLSKFNSERKLRLQPYPLAVYGCMLMVAKEYGDLTCELFFDHLDKVDSKVVTARRYAESDSYYSGLFDRVAAFPLPKAITFRELPALQAADFFTWEFRKNHERVYLDKPTDDVATSLPSVALPRKSAAALVEGNQIAPIIWDYGRLCEAHELRGGKWS